jgi:hypothetical protein
MMGDERFANYMRWVGDGIVFFLRPHQSLLKEDGVRAGVSWESVLRIDGMIKLMLEQYRIDYLPIESVSMQERVRAVEFVLGRAGLAAAKRQPRPLPVANAAATGASTPSRSKSITGAPIPGNLTGVESWPYHLAERKDHEA